MSRRSGRPNNATPKSAGQGRKRPNSVSGLIGAADDETPSRAVFDDVDDVRRRRARFDHRWLLIGPAFRRHRKAADEYAGLPGRRAVKLRWQPDRARTPQLRRASEHDRRPRGTVVETQREHHTGSRDLRGDRSWRGTRGHARLRVFRPCVVFSSSSLTLVWRGQPPLPPLIRGGATKAAGDSAPVPQRPPS